MVDKIYSKDHLENVRTFQDIKNGKNYSPYSIQLNRVFGDKSYDTFYKNLIEHKRATGGNFLSLFEKPKKVSEMKVYDEPFNKAKFEEALKVMKIKSNELNYRIKNPYSSRPINNSITKVKTQKLLKNISNKKMGKKIVNLKGKENIYLPEVPDVGRYNPSYDVLRKHTYQVLFSTNNFTDFNSKGTPKFERDIFKGLDDTDYNSKNYKQINIISHINPKINEKKTNLNESIKMNKRNRLYINTSPRSNKRKKNQDGKSKNNESVTTNFSQIVIRNNGDVHSRCQKHINNLFNTNSSLSLDDSKLNNSSIINNSNFNSTVINLKNNHCLKFDNYSQRKPMAKKLNYTTENFTNPDAFNLNYPVRNKNACVEFNKLSTGKEKQKCVFEVEANKNKNPPLGIYYPRFDSTFSKLTTNIFLDKKIPPITNEKRLKKIILSYKVPSHYLLFNSLNENN